MKELSYQLHSYVDFVHALGRHYRTVVQEAHLQLPAHVGKGFFKAHPLPNGMVLLTYRFQLEEHLAMYRLSYPNRYFYLSLHETEGETGNMNHVIRNWPKHAIVDGNTVQLEHSHQANRMILPANLVHKGVHLLFEPKHLELFMDPADLDVLMNGFFGEGAKPALVEPMNGAYRNFMEQLLNPNEGQTLRNIHTEITSWQLLETFVVNQLGKEHKPASGNLHADEVQRLMKVEALLMRDYSKPAPTIDELARIASVSATKLKKDFKQLYGMPVFEYYQRHRMQKAKELLLRNEFSIKGVGIMVGYSNLGHFAAAFKKEFGILPSELGVKARALEAVAAEAEAGMV